MKIFIYDQKHEQITKSVDLGDLTDYQKKVVRKIVDFLNEDDILNGSKTTAILAKGFRQEPHYDDDGDYLNTTIEFDY